jgi:hypothetical protein
MLPPSKDDLSRQVTKLNKINTALIERVERSVEQQGNAYSLLPRPSGSSSKFDNAQMNCKKPSNAWSALTRR